MMPYPFLSTPSRLSQLRCIIGQVPSSKSTFFQRGCILLQLSRKEFSTVLVKSTVPLLSGNDTYFSHCLFNRRFSDDEHEKQSESPSEIFRQNSDFKTEPLEKLNQMGSPEKLHVARTYIQWLSNYLSESPSTSRLSAEQIQVLEDMQNEINSILCRFSDANITSSDSSMTTVSEDVSGNNRSKLAIDVDEPYQLVKGKPKYHFVKLDREVYNYLWNSNNKQPEKILIEEIFSKDTSADIHFRSNPTGVEVAGGEDSVEKMRAIIEEFAKSVDIVHIPHILTIRRPAFIMPKYATRMGVDISINRSHALIVAKDKPADTLKQTQETVERCLKIFHAKDADSDSPLRANVLTETYLHGNLLMEAMKRCDPAVADLNTMSDDYRIRINIPDNRQKVEILGSDANSTETAKNLVEAFLSSLISERVPKTNLPSKLLKKTSLLGIVSREFGVSSWFVVDEDKSEWLQVVGLTEADVEGALVELEEVVKAQVALVPSCLVSVITSDEETSAKLRKAVELSDVTILWNLADYRKWDSCLTTFGTASGKRKFQTAVDEIVKELHSKEELEIPLNWDVFAYLSSEGMPMLGKFFEETDPSLEWQVNEKKKRHFLCIRPPTASAPIEGFWENFGTFMQRFQHKKKYDFPFAHQMFFGMECAAEVPEIAQISQLMHSEDLIVRFNVYHNKQRDFITLFSHSSDVLNEATEVFDKAKANLVVRKQAGSRRKVWKFPAAYKPEVLTMQKEFKVSIRAGNSSTQKSEGEIMIVGASEEKVDSCFQKVSELFENFDEEANLLSRMVYLPRVRQKFLANPKFAHLEMKELLELRNNGDIFFRIDKDTDVTSECIEIRGRSEKTIDHVQDIFDRFDKKVVQKEVTFERKLWSRVSSLLFTLHDDPDWVTLNTDFIKPKKNVDSNSTVLTFLTLREQGQNIDKAIEFIYSIGEFHDLSLEIQYENLLDIALRNGNPRVLSEIKLLQKKCKVRTRSYEPTVFNDMRVCGITKNREMFKEEVLKLLKQLKESDEDFTRQPDESMQRNEIMDPQDIIIQNQRKRQQDNLIDIHGFTFFQAKNTLIPELNSRFKDHATVVIDCGRGKNSQHGVKRLSDVVAVILEEEKLLFERDFDGDEEMAGFFTVSRPEGFDNIDYDILTKKCESYF